MSPIIDNRQQQLEQWLGQQPEMRQTGSLSLLAQGASGRRFFRIQGPATSYIIMDAPPPQENSNIYVDVATRLAQQGITVPEMIAHEPEQGFVLMSDFGDQLYWQILDKHNADQLYSSAMAVLIKLQQTTMSLPSFDTAAMMIGLNGFEQVFLQQHLKRPLTNAGSKILRHCFEQLIDNARSQPQAPMHRDYHSQNLLRLDNQQTGVVDFQDAKIGPITYDLVSLLRDCYIDWPPEQIARYVLAFFQQLQDKKMINKQVSLMQFQHWFDWMGIKRHLKACFTFARKKVEQDDDHYLQYLPRTLRYVHQSCQYYPALSPFRNWFEQEVLAYVAVDIN